jgi:hypothetical protein
MLTFWIWVCWLTAGLLNKFAFQKLWCPLSLCLRLQHFWGHHPGFGKWCFHLLVTSTVSPAHWEASPAVHHWTVLIQRREPLSLRAEEVTSGSTKEPGNVWEPTWELCLSDRQEPGFKFRPASGDRRGVWSTLKKHPSNHPFWESNCLSSSEIGVEVLCCVRVCQSVSLRCSLVMKQV